MTLILCYWEMELGKNLRTLRHTKGWTLKEVSRRSKLTLSYMSNVERGWRKPSLEALLTLSRVYGVSTDYLLSCERKDETKIALAAKYSWFLQDLEGLPKEKQAEAITFVRFLSQRLMKERQRKTSS